MATANINVAELMIEFEEAKEKIQNQKDFYENILETIINGVWVTDKNDMINYANNGMGIIAGLLSSKIVRFNILTDFSKKSLKLLLSVYKKTKKSLIPTRYDSINIINRKGNDRYQSGWFIPLVKNDKFNGMICTVEDITEKTIAEIKIKKAVKKAREASRIKSEFLANMSHEIRTSMNGVIGMLDMLISTELTSIQIDYAEAANNSANTLLVLINDILDFSKIEAGKLEIESIPFDLQKKVDEFSDIMAIKADSKGIHFSLLIKNNVPKLLKGDPIRLRQILNNLTENAIKFVSKGEVQIKISLQKETKKYAIILFEVIDSGIRIPKERMDRLFQPFSQIDASTTRKYGGSGLGLMISKQLTELRNGKSSVESTMGKGSRFFFTIKFLKQPEKQLVKRKKNQRSIKILKIRKFWLRIIMRIAEKFSMNTLKRSDVSLMKQMMA